MFRILGWNLLPMGKTDGGLTVRLWKWFSLLGLPVWLAPAGHRVKTYKRGESFAAAGKTYTSPEELRAEGGEWMWARGAYGFHEMVGAFRDVYGRRILYVAERFHCYDYYDLRYDSRYTRAYYLRRGGKLTCICFDDGYDTFTVTEDVGRLEKTHWKKLKALYAGKKTEEETE